MTIVAEVVTDIANLVDDQEAAVAAGHIVVVGAIDRRDVKEDTSR